MFNAIILRMFIYLYILSLYVFWSITFLQLSLIHLRNWQWCLMSTTNLGMNPWWPSLERNSQPAKGHTLDFIGCSHWGRGCGQGWVWVGTKASSEWDLACIEYLLYPRCFTILPPTLHGCPVDIIPSALQLAKPRLREENWAPCPESPRAPALDHLTPSKATAGISSPLLRHLDQRCPPGTHGCPCNLLVALRGGVT